MRSQRSGSLILNRPRSICFAAQGGNYTKSRPGGRWVELWRQPRVSLILFFLVTFRYFVSEMVLTCAVPIYIICKYGNGEIFTQCVGGKWVKASLMLVNRTRRRKKFLELAIWEVYYGRKRGLMNVDKQHVMHRGPSHHICSK